MFDRIWAAFGASVMRAKADLGDPPVFILGMPRSGAILVARCGRLIHSTPWDRAVPASFRIARWFSRVLDSLKTLRGALTVGLSEFFTHATASLGDPYRSLW
jgi:hypothetical protein